LSSNASDCDNDSAIEDIGCTRIAPYRLWHLLNAYAQRRERSPRVNDTTSAVQAVALTGDGLTT